MPVHSLRENLCVCVCWFKNAHISLDVGQICTDLCYDVYALCACIDRYIYRYIHKDRSRMMIACIASKNSLVESSFCRF